MMNKFTFLTKFSLKKKIATKWFFIANLFIVIGLIALINIDSVIKFFGGKFNETTEVMVIDNDNNYFDYFSNSIDQYNKMLNIENYKVEQTNKKIEDIKKDLKKDENKILVIINQDEENYINAEVMSYEGIDTAFYQTITMSINAVRSQIALNKYNITVDMQNDINKPVEITRTRLDDGKTDDEMTELITGIIFPILVLPLFMLTMFLVQMIGAEVNEEKTTKSMEVIISNVSPKVHFFSKVLAGNLFVLIQTGIIGIASLIGLAIRYFVNKGNMLGEFSTQIGDIANALSLNGILDKLQLAIPVTIVLMILTFLAYSLSAGILASMTTNVEDYQQLQTPIVLVSTVGYYLAIMSFLFEGSTFIKIISYVPFISSLLAPTLLVMGQIGIIDIVIATVIMVVFNYLLIKYGLRIYKVGILNYSSTGLWKKMFKAMKED